MLLLSVLLLILSVSAQSAENYPDPNAVPGIDPAQYCLKSVSNNVEQPSGPQGCQV